MVKHFLLFTALFFSINVIAQTGIGTVSPHPSAKLEVNATNKGFLPPRVTLASVTDVSTIPSPATGLLVYNIGSVGLQAGYYYWNGANWATIATAALAGNAVVASDLVKLYHEAYAITAGKASSSDGYSFTVPASGRYEFNFNCTGWNSNGSKIKLTFNIRQGTTVLGSDYHESTNSNAWAEYEGRVEVNLTAGVTYNAQIVTTTGNRTVAADWDKIMYKMVAGNLPVNQHMADRNIQLNNNYLSNDGGNEGVRVDNSGNVGIGTATPSDLLVVGSSIALHDGGDKVVGIGWSPGSGKAIVAGYPAEMRLSPSTGKLSFGTDPSSRSIGSNAGPQRRMTITSGGNIGIGTEDPTEKLEVSGNVKATNFIGGEIPIYLSANKATSQSIPFNTETIITNWNGTSWINNFPSAWNSTTGVWTCPRAGIYEFYFTAALDPHSGSSIGNEFAVILSLNGSLQSVGDFWAQTSSLTRAPHATTNLIMSLNVGDVITTRIYQNLNGNAINTIAGRLYFQIKQLPSRINRE